MWLLMRLMFGTNDPVPDRYKYVVSLWKGKPILYSIECVNGYLMYRFYFKNGSSLDFRDFPRKYYGTPTYEPFSHSK